MIQRFDRTALPSTRAIAVTAIERAMPAAGSMMALPVGEIAGDFRASGRLDRRRRATYELLIANNTPSPIATFAYALESPAQSRVTWDAIIVPAHSAVAVDIDVARTKGRAPRMIAEVYAHDSMLVIDAKTDPGAARDMVRRAIAAVTGVAIVLGCSLAYASMRPEVASLAVPQTVASGANFDVAYQAHGSNADYSVSTPDGKTIAAGTLDPRGGSFSVALPKADVSLGYDVTVAATSPLGNDARSAHVVALAAPPPPVAVVRPPRTLVNVTHVSLASDTVKSGQPIVVSYRSTVPSGTVRLIDQYGTVRGEALISSRGRSTLVAPYVDANQDLRVVVSAERGDAHAASAVPVTIEHVDPAAAAVPALVASTSARTAAAAPETPVTRGAAADPEDAAARAPQTQSTSGPVVNDAPEPVVVVPGPPISVEATQFAGQPVRVHVLRHDAGLHLSMMAPGGAELVSENVSPGVSSVLLEAPSELRNGGRGYSIVATFSRGVGEETVIRPISFSK